MRRSSITGVSVLCYLLSSLLCSAQDSVQQIPSKYIVTVSSRTGDLENKLEKKTAKTIQQMAAREAKMKRKLEKTDSLLAQSIFGDINSAYKSLDQNLQGSTSPTQYIPFLDTLKTSLKFLEQNSSFVSQANQVKEKLQGAMSKVNGLESSFQKAADIKKFLKDREQLLKEQLNNLGFAKQLKRLNKQVYYYSQQINQYKALLHDRKKAERMAIELLSQTKIFQDFFRRNSFLASLFLTPDPDDPAYLVNLAGLQTRAQVNNLIQQQIAAGGPGAMQQVLQNAQQAQSQLNQLKSKILKSGGGSSDDAVANFKPNDQKTKSFLKRLEYGTNIQTQKATNFFPVTSDIGLSVGYKLNDKSIIGIGASYKMGWGRGWNNIRITNQGVGLRSFIDWKLKGNLYLSGGYEQNYKTAFSDFNQLSDRNAWQQSGLLGLSKSIPVKSKFFKKTKLQLFWDFLSYQQVPRTQPVVFRIGYNFQ